LIELNKISSYDALKKEDVAGFHRLRRDLVALRSCPGSE
jgi:hypothetical protein